MKIPIGLAVLFVAATGANEPTLFEIPKAGFGGGPSIEVKELGTKSQVDTHWQGGNGSFDKSFYQRKNIAVIVSNMSSKPVNLTLDVLWIATKAADHSVRVITRQTHPLQIGKAQTNTTAAESPETNSTWLHLETLKEDWMSGAKMGGWIAVLRDGARVVNWKSSAAAGDTLMHDPLKLEELLKSPAVPESLVP